MKLFDVSTEIILLRHGECEGGQIFRGSTDVPLSDTGREQMLHSSDGLECDVVVSSPLRRCREFSEIFADQKKLPIEFNDELREMNFGVWEGREIADVWQKNEKEMMAWTKDPSVYTPPKAEALADVSVRVKTAHEYILEQYRGKRVLVVSHGGAIRVLLTHILNMPLSHIMRIDIPYAGMAKVAFFHGEQGDIVKLLSLN